MSGFFWNIREFNKVNKHKVVRDWIKKEGFQFGGLMETRVREKNALRIASTVFSDWSLLTNYEENRLGKIWVLCSPKVRVTPCFKSSQMITCFILLDGMDEEIICSFVYVANTMEDRRELWSDLKAHQSSSLIKDKPWLVIGDFNETLATVEHSDLNYVPTVTAGMRDFQDATRYCTLMDMKYHGPRLTWCNKRDEGLICKKLDRTLMNHHWSVKYPDAYCTFESGGCSDHMRCRIIIKPEPLKAKRPFKFINAVADSPNFIPAVKTFWESTEALFPSTSATHRMSKKLKAMKPVLRKLSKENIGDIEKKTKSAYDLLCKCQNDTLSNPSIQSMEEETRAYERWNLLSGIEEKVLSQRAKIQWLKIGDGNNKNFHRVATVRRANNTIRELQRKDGSRATTQDELKQEAVDHFQGFLTHQAECRNTTVDELHQLLQFECEELDKEMLVQQVSDEEVKKTLFSMANNKSPGPDGFTCEFYKSAWQVIGKDFTTAVQSFFIYGFLPTGVNATILALIPKKEGVKHIKDFRPISCCNVLYKVISKILANRLKKLLPKFISPTQSAFVKERLLMENVLLASELVKSYHKENLTSRCAAMIDISKAFDTVHWTFLLNTLKALKLPDKYVLWIERCITLATFSVQVNGELAGYFKSERGLRQGCSLSPYLFVICMEVLSKLLDRAASMGKIGYHPYCNDLKLTHLSFADDMLVFADGKKKSIEGILEVFTEFTAMSGLSISLEKSTLFMSGVSEPEQTLILAEFPFGSGSLPVRYLGLPLLTKRMTAHDFSPLIERIRSRINSWTARNLSLAGRLQLIGSVIHSITTFWISVFRLPKACIAEIDSICAAFLWSGPEMNHRKAKVGWKDVCKPKEEGGLGLRSISEVNNVSCLKLIWLIISDESSLWVKWIHKHLIRKGSFWLVNEKSSKGSWIWRKLLKYRPIAWPLTRVDINCGAQTSFWMDIWSPLGRLIDITGQRGCIDLGININATVETAVHTRRRRRHRRSDLCSIEEEIQKLQVKGLNQNTDVRLWMHKSDQFKEFFSTKHTLKLIRIQQPTVTWDKGIWFAFATPKFSVFVWLAMLNRLHTGDRMRRWAPQAVSICILCNAEEECRDHLYFQCIYTKEIWENLTKKLFGRHYTNQWDDIVKVLTDSSLGKVHLFLCRYVFQASAYLIWWERNRRKHGEDPIPSSTIIRNIDRTVRNRITSMADMGAVKYEGAMRTWFASRPTL